MCKWEESHLGASGFCWIWDVHLVSWHSRSVPVSWWLFLWSLHGLSLLSALADAFHSVRCCWWAADPSAHLCEFIPGAWGKPPSAPTSRLCFRVTLRPKQLPTNSPGVLELAEGEQPWVMLAPEKVTWGSKETVLVLCLSRCAVITSTMGVWYVWHSEMHLFSQDHTE